MTGVRGSANWGDDIRVAKAGVRHGLAPWCAMRGTVGGVVSEQMVNKNIDGK
jgi:hypothetical protein